MLQQQEWASAGHRMQLQYLKSEVSRFRVHQETLSFPGINPGPPGEVSTGLQLPECSHSSSPAAVSAQCKQRDLHGVDSGTVDTTLPINSSTMDTPTGKAGPREGQTISSDSSHSSASLFASSISTYPAFHPWGLGA